MEFINQRVKLNIDSQSRGQLPAKDALEALRPGNYVRLQAETGAYFWARVLRRYNKQLILVADDSLPSGDLRRGDEVTCSTGCVFAVV